MTAPNPEKSKPKKTSTIPSYNKLTPPANPPVNALNVFKIVISNPTN